MFYKPLVVSGFAGNVRYCQFGFFMKIVKKYLGFGLGMLTLLLFQIASFFPNAVEVLYTNSFYKIIRFVYGWTLFYFPIALMYVFILIISFILMRHLIRRIKNKNKQTSLRFLLNFVGWLIFSFYWLWGFNYARADFKERIDLTVTKPTSEFLMSELIKTDSLMLPLRRMISENDTLALPTVQLPKDYQKEIRLTQKKLIAHLGEPNFGNVRIRQLVPKGNLLRIKTAGVYLPFVLEGHIDDGLHNIEKPYVLAHEMAHANGFTDEGVCNFIGFMTCINAKDPFIQYSGWLEYEGYLYRTLRRNHPEILKERNYSRPVFVRADLKAIIETLNQYPNISPKLRDLFYNNYLKAQGVHAGMKSYSQIIQLSYSYKKERGGFILEE